MTARPDYALHQADAQAWLADQPPDSVDLVFTSPPYEAARTYGIGFALEGQAWVDWLVPIVRESVRVSRGLVAFVVEGRTRAFRWSATPALLMADLHRAGIHLRKPPAYRRVGIPGSGGPDWIRNDYEFVVCCSKGGKLAWSDPLACGQPPKYTRGGKFSHRTQTGKLANGRAYPQLEKANPGNVIDLGSAGGGHLGHPLAHVNEAPFPLALAEFFVRSFCPPGGLVLDPFVGSGTTGHACALHGRRFVGVDIRASQIELAARRLSEDL